jgi:hypothetical protein
MKTLIKNIFIFFLMPIALTYASGPTLKPAGYEVSTTCADCPRWKRGKELILKDFKDHKIKSWWLGRQKEDKKVLAHNDPRATYTMERFKSSGIGLDHKIYEYKEVSRAAIFPQKPQDGNALASIALLQIRSASVLDFLEFEYPHDDLQLIQPEESSINFAITLLDTKGDELWSLDKKDVETLASGPSWISSEASIIGLLHFEDKAGFYVKFYDLSGNSVYRLPPVSFVQNAEKLMINFAKSSTVFTPSGLFVLAVSYPKKGKYKGVRKYNRGTFVLDTKTGHVNYFNEKLNPEEAIARLRASKSPKAILKPTRP